MREDSVWASYHSDYRNEYINSIKAMGALSPLFRQKSNDPSDKTTYISSKYQENAFAQSFKGEVIDKGNEPYDIRIPSATSGKFDLVGIKTFLFASSSLQKVMQFKSIANEENWNLLIANGQLSEVMLRIAQVRNKKLRAFRKTSQDRRITDLLSSRILFITISARRPMARSTSAKPATMR